MRDSLRSGVESATAGRAVAGKTDLGDEGKDSGVGLCLQLEEAVD